MSLSHWTLIFFKWDKTGIHTKAACFLSDRDNCASERPGIHVAACLSLPPSKTHTHLQNNEGSLISGEYRKQSKKWKSKFEVASPRKDEEKGPMAVFFFDILYKIPQITGQYYSRLPLFTKLSPVGLNVPLSKALLFFADFTVAEKAVTRTAWNDNIWTWRKEGGCIVKDWDEQQIQERTRWEHRAFQKQPALNVHHEPLTAGEVGLLCQKRLRCNLIYILHRPLLLCLLSA